MVHLSEFAVRCLVLASRADQAFVAPGTFRAGLYDNASPNNKKAALRPSNWFRSSLPRRGFQLNASAVCSTSTYSPS
jgi:hypothetical protein